VAREARLGQLARRGRVVLGLRDRGAGRETQQDDDRSEAAR
jgi:hypothetical protein